MDNVVRHLVRALWIVLVLTSTLTSLQAQSPPSPIAPNLFLSANDEAAVQTYQGWPLLLEADLSNPELYSSDAITSLLINPLNGSWANTIRLVVTDANGTTQTWPIQPASVPAGSLTLDATNTGRLSWAVAASDTAAIVPGTYRVVAVLDTTSSAGTSGWSGIRSSNPVSIQIAVPPGSPTLAQQERQFELLARYDHLFGNDAQALADLDQLLSTQPSAVRALALRGRILAQSGNPTDALAAYDAALAAFFKANPGKLPEAPIGLILPDGQLRSVLLSQAENRGQPQISIRVIAQGTHAPGVLYLDLQITNVGTDVAQNVMLSQFGFRTLNGTGQVTLSNAASPSLPILKDILPVGLSATVRVFLNRPATVLRFSISENGTVTDIAGAPHAFAAAQAIIP